MDFNGQQLISSTVMMSQVVWMAAESEVGSERWEGKKQEAGEGGGVYSVD